MFQLLGVVTYNCDAMCPDTLKHRLKKFQLLGVVTYNCDKSQKLQIGSNIVVSVIRSSNL